MTEKPDWCPSDVWATAQESAAHFCGTGLTVLMARTIMAEREACSVKAHEWLAEWGAELGATWEGYLDAKVSGRHGGRKITPKAADLYAKQFRERSEAVTDCAEQVGNAIRNRT